ncbi:interleukin-17C [Xyrichtys novacula]|uniref:Interleukin-17C n=1 Tax=Xyrichtys novacula TaxID=13765 RepID=A0AAV1F939_XYRNO|nr:interleukin-17C [Xyrichtys novacula]
MDLKQILILGLLLVPVLTNRCRQEHANGKWLKKHLQLRDSSVAASLADPGPSCPVELYRKHPPTSMAGRSLSPWRYVNRTLTDHFPSSYIEAECLCQGCIMIQNDTGAGKGLDITDDYVSKPLMQTRMFLKKEPCGDEGGYHFKPVYLKVAVGCVCLRPETTQSG